MSKSRQPTPNIDDISLDPETYAINDAQAADQPNLPRGSKTICLPFDEPSYSALIADPMAYRLHIQEQYAAHPELFPSAMEHGFELHDIRPESVKLGIKQRRIKLKATGAVYSICPAFVMPYMVGLTKDVKHALLLLGFGVPYWVLTEIFGHNDMYWYRLSISFGRASIVGTTVKDPENLPQDIAADEKHTSLQGDKAYIATTVSEGCVLGASVCEGADAESFTDGYGVFAEEAQNVDPDYQPSTVNVDGLAATTLAWKNLFPLITIILCFLHSFIKIRERGKKLGSIFGQISDAIWSAYKAPTKQAFVQRLRRLREWAESHLDPGIVRDKILALCSKASLFAKAYNHPDAYRTSNMVDRLMRRMDRFLFNRQYFHRSLPAAELSIRAWAILHNFRPYSPRAVGKRTDGQCAAERLNGFRYSDDWLENLRISSSMNGFRQ